MKRYVNTGILVATRETQEDGNQIPCWRGIKIVEQEDEEGKEEMEGIAEEQSIEDAFGVTE